MPAPFRLLFACSLVAVCGAAAGPSTTLAHLPNTGINAVKVDAAGNIYIAGFQGTVGTPDSYDAFVAKLSPDGSKVLYSTKFAGSKSDYAAALDIDSTGAAYVFGQTQSPDFPVTPGAFQTTMLASSVQGFLAKVDAQGKVVYATLVGGSADIYPSAGGLLVDAAGEVVVSGQTIGGNFPNTPGAPYTSTDTNTFFVLKLDASGAKLLAAIRGVGGRIATDDQGSIYVAGSQIAGYTASCLRRRVARIDFRRLAGRRAHAREPRTGPCFALRRFGSSPRYESRRLAACDWPLTHVQGPWVIVCRQWSRCRAEWRNISAFRSRR